ncbi:MAG: TetR/AcrR family transcriptional regulator [Bacteroidales bacterium]|nr:TetR/AcrR family transcriptional regulator [Bacteroidales bacterium]
MVNTQQGTEEKILEAAKKVFHRKGYEGARMQEIADEAEINKALLHYYFRSKENLFEAVFKDAFFKLMGRAKTVFLSDKPLKEKIQEFLSHYLDVLSENSYIPWFILNGMYERPDVLKVIFEKAEINPLQLMERLRNQIQDEYGSEVNPFHIWLNVLSLSIFPVVAKPLIRELFQITEEGYQQILEQRKTEVPRFITNALKGYEENS